MTALFMASLESTIASVAMPVAVSELMGEELYIWPITGYILASTISGPIWGRLSDLRGRRSSYLAGIVTFVVGSLLAGISVDMVSLTLFRVIQGIGGGALFVLTFTVIGAIFRLEERGRVTGYTSSVWGISSVIGPIIGGFIVETVGWRWVYLINVPPGLLCIYLIYRYLRLDGPNSSAVGRGINLVSVSLFATMVCSAFILIDGGLSSELLIYLILPVSVLSFAFFLYNELRSREPFIPLHVYRNGYNTYSMAINVLAGFIFFGSISVTPPILQWVVGLSPMMTGMALTAITISWVFANIVGSRLVVRYDPASLMRVGGVLLAISMTMIAITQLPVENLTLILTSLILLGAGMGFTVPVSVIAVQTLARREELGIITSFLSFVRMMGAAVGTQIMWVSVSGVVLDGTVMGVDNFPFLSSFGVGGLAAVLIIAMTFLVRFPNLLEAEKREVHRGDG